MKKKIRTHNVDDIDLYKSMFLNACKAIAAQWQSGMYKHWRNHRQPAYYMIVELERQIDELWGKDIKLFREILKKWYLRHIEIIKEDK